ncbi:hypothetical protein Poli38472_008146 [Pythium oligandrum]|uniref:Uncharacterized protein n=1 Tax=Pythium oligandrum TaxID=41045 RepID=A0A8K1FLQ8_PYTOL|nr:hypothetical protein Poli38472_008146 [Pythium oligandrum]|eukprot:TMW65504.1 hypothetical protein Poli38472_008146 [Pythium oligandrum]
MQRGIQVTKKRHTVDGFEATVGTNHIGHFLLVKLLQDRVKRVISVCSETQDPAERTGLPPPNVTSLDELAKGYNKFNPQEAYTTSKLLNILHVKELARRSPEGPEVIAYTPGFTPGTSLTREHPKVLVPIVMAIMRLVFWCRSVRVSSIAYSGGHMASIAAADSLEAHGWHSGNYINIDRVMNPSSLACDPVLSKALWGKSEEWVRPFAN